MRRGPAADGYRNSADGRCDRLRGIGRLQSMTKNAAIIKPNFFILSSSGEN